MSNIAKLVYGGPTLCPGPTLFPRHGRGHEPVDENETTSEESQEADEVDPTRDLPPPIVTDKSESTVPRREAPAGGAGGLQ